MIRVNFSKKDIFDRNIKKLNVGIKSRFQYLRRCKSILLRLTSC